MAQIGIHIAGGEILKILSMRGSFDKKEQKVAQLEQVMVACSIRLHGEKKAQEVFDDGAKTFWDLSKVEQWAAVMISVMDAGKITRIPDIFGKFCLCALRPRKSIGRID